MPVTGTSTPVDQFLYQVYSKTAIWLKTAQRGHFQQQQQRQWHSQSAPQDGVHNQYGNGQRIIVLALAKIEGYGIYGYVIG